MFQDSYCHKVLTAALTLASADIAVFPCIYREKEPATKHGFYDATTNPATIKRTFGGNFRRNLAARTGLTSRIWVLDADDPDSLKALQDRYGPLPQTRQSQTSRGPHLWFKTTTVPIPSSKGRVAPGIDVKAEGGLCRGTPEHPSGRPDLQMAK
jgi:Bifunctional DNA primase/polymerase, N-terminal